MIIQVPAIAIHPGEVLSDELKSRNISQFDFALQIGLKRSQLNEIIKGKRAIKPNLSLLLEKALNINAEYWLNLQNQYDLDKIRIAKRDNKRLEA